MSTQEGGPQLNKKNLLFYFDAANPKSYDRTSSNGYSMVLGTTASLLTGVTFSSVNNGSMVFNGTYSIGLFTYTVDSWITCGDRISKLAPTFPITMEAWINPTPTGITTLAGNNIFALDSIEQFPGNYYGVSMGIGPNNGTNTHTFDLGYGNGVDYGVDARKSASTDTRPIICGVWSHVVGVLSALNTFQLYVNGELIPISTSGNNTTGIVWSNGVGKTTIGKGYGYYKYIFNGNISMVRAYNSALTANDVKLNYNLHATRFNLPKK